MDYKIYMIRMKDHPVSQLYYNLVADSWKDYNVISFDATTPKDLIYKNQLRFSKKGKRDFTATEMAVWYSHFNLWCKCIALKTPILILEHDSKLVKPLPDLSNEGYKLLSFLNRDFGKKGVDISPGSGYYITVPIAERLVAQAVCKPLNVNSDGHIVSILNLKRQQKLNDYEYIEQVNIDGLNTINHHNPHRNFIGFDYEENIDLPSIHRQ